MASGSKINLQENIIHFATAGVFLATSNANAH
jgi:hypothetical protein